MLVPHGSTDIGVAHDIHHHREISGRSISRLAKGVTCAIQHQGIGQSSFGETKEQVSSFRFLGL
jgi:hypothetical protein